MATSYSAWLRAPRPACWCPRSPGRTTTFTWYQHLSSPRTGHGASATGSSAPRWWWACSAGGPCLLATRAATTLRPGCCRADGCLSRRTAVTTRRRSSSPGVGPDGLILARHYSLDVKPATQILARRSIRTLAKGESLTLTSDMFSDLVPGTASVSLSASQSTALDAATILQALDRYPYGCSEQITSRAMPLLYVNELATEAHLALDTAVDQRIRDAIDRLLARQGSNGSFGLWSAGGDDVWLDAYVTDFLTRAREALLRCPTSRSSSRSTGCATSWARPRTRNGRRARSRLCALCAGAQRRGADRRSALFRRHQARQSRPRSPRRRLAAALGMLGDRARAERVYAAALTGLGRRRRCWNSAAPTTARPCAIRRRWCRSLAKAMRRGQR